MLHRVMHKVKWFFVLAVVLTALMILASQQTVRAEVVDMHHHSLGGFSLMWQEFTESKRTLYDEEDLHVLSAVMQLENGDANDRCLLLTGSVLINRAKYCSWCPNTLRGCVFQGYKDSSFPQQYATNTVTKLDTVKVSNRVRHLAIQLLIFGTICPRNVVYQAMSQQGSGVYDKIPSEYNDEDIEYFCYE